MSLSKYEAASFYDYVLGEYSLKKDYLVIDLDDCSCGWCTCDGKSEIRLNEAWSKEKENIWQSALESIEKAVPDIHSVNIEREVESQILSANQAFRNYFLSDRLVNPEAFSFLDHSISCADLEQNLSVSKKKLSDLLFHGTNMVSDEKMPDASIILLGKAQELFMVQYYIREYISFDPMLPDDRFRNPRFKVPYTEVVQNGKTLFESMAALKHTYELMAFNPKTNSLESIYDVSNRKAASSEAELEFSRPILICDGEDITIRADHSFIKIALPYVIGAAGCDLIEAAVGLKNNEDTLFIRRCRFSSRIYTIKLS